MIHRLSEQLTGRSAALLLTIDRRLDSSLKIWLIGAGLASAARITFNPPSSAGTGLSTFASYILLVIAPFASTLLALHWFEDGHLQRQPSIRLARAGSWRGMPREEAQLHPLYGTSGIMVSLLLGMMLNVPIRAAEYMAAMPPLPQAAPRWLLVLQSAMTFDVVLFGSLYMIAFVAALRRVPLFPRLLVTVWIADLAMQLFTAKLVAGAGPLPWGVGEALDQLLEGNVKKVLISAALWLPYLLLSTRVNVTYRLRVPA
jgi:hypothetical protein